jgi:uncharacterized membrane protein
MQRLPSLAVLLSALGGICFLVLAVQFFRGGDWTMAVLVGAAAVGLLWLAREDFSRDRRP